MFYETAQTIGPGWHRSYKPPHYDDMTWSPSSRHFRSPGSSPETYRRIIRTEEDFPKRPKEQDDEFFSDRRSPTFSRKIFKDVWPDSSSSNHRFADRPRLFKRVFKPSNWEEDFDRDIPHIRRVERNFDHDFEDGGKPMPRNFEDEFEKRFNARDLKKDIQEEFQKAEGRVHHIPIMVEKRMEEMKSRFGRNSPPPEKEHDNEEEYSEEWVGPQVQNLRKTFEPEDNFSSKYRHRYPKLDLDSRPRAFTNPVADTWDPHAVHTLPTRRAHKNSQSFDDSRHPVTPKSVFRSYSETHDDAPRNQQSQHSAAFRSHSDGHCPKQTYVTKIEVNLPSQKEKEELRYKNDEDLQDVQGDITKERRQQDQDASPQNIDLNGDDESNNAKPKTKSKYENASMQQIMVILQNVEDLVRRVEAYSGTGRDKQYRFLDEMLTRCMLRLDDVDTEGREDIRNARKAAVREVQSCIDKLEAQADESEKRLKQQKIQNSKQQTDPTSGSQVPENKDSKKDSKDKEQNDEVQCDSSSTSARNAIPLPSSSTSTRNVIPLPSPSTPTKNVIALPCSMPMDEQESTKDDNVTNNGVQEQTKL